MTTMRCPDCDGTESVLATDGATAMCAECTGMSGDGVEMESFDDECPSDGPVNLHTVMSADAPTLSGIALEQLGEIATLTAALDDANNLASCQRDTIETLTRALHDAADRLGCADYDDVCAAVSDALDDAEKREREGVDEANALRMERDRLQRACDEGLPRERIDCPSCGERHVEGPRHDDPSVDGRTRPHHTHHTHRCYHCGHVWDARRWSFGVAEGEETTVAPSEVARLDDATRGALDDLARVHAELDAACASLDRAHHALREYGPRCSHPDCDALAPLRCDDCGARFCDAHDDGRAGHDADVAASMPHAVGPDDLMAGAAMRAAEVAQ